ncbi:hypothetical protein VHEMI03153 [[Torrubiella] hemipterigena]|uniref:C2H2-type domain-containing protein n=1 Tax=[Torrubiella] hemipterigena TaxID=1531966 RepID=A0A0A1TCQ5_9HYPO|nr:hypothetical protein VHEMI03153 [[Torrubiella] hemipterigena]
MFPFNGQEDNSPKPLADEDQQLLSGLVHKYGVSSVMYALTGFGESSRASIFSTNTLMSSTNASINAPSLAWSSSDASACRSDGASLHTACTWPDAVAEMPVMHDGEGGKLNERSWLDSPAPIPSPMVNGDAPSPRLIAPTGKKYQCPMCYLDSSPVGFGRKSDFKKHLHNFHGADVVWICWTKGCNLTFSTERAYSTHAKEAHRMKALPNSAARTDLCPQLVFSCGFTACKDRVFEASCADESSATRDKHFEHIAKHFEDGYDISTWEYKVQIQNLLRQQQVKSTWKTCIFPKEKRQALVWKPRSSGDLKRILESRHLGSDISNLVRLAFILGNAPFSLSATPPPGELETYFQLPYLNTCPTDKPARTPSPSGMKNEDEGTSSSSFSLAAKYRSSTQTVFRLPTRNSKRVSRPPTPVTSEPANDVMMADESAAGPHPTTPYQMTNDNGWAGDASKFTPDDDLPKQMHGPMDGSMMYPMHSQEQMYQGWAGVDSMHHGMDSQMHQGIPIMDGMPYQQDPVVNTGLYNYAMNASQVSTVRPGTPTPHKRPGSWTRVMSMDTLRPSKKTSTISMNTTHSFHDAPVMMSNGMNM